MIRVFIADDHAIVREGLARLVRSESDMMVVGEAADGDGVLAAISSERFDVLLLDLSMPGRSGLDVLTRVKAENSRIKVVVLTMHAEDQYALRVLKAGADGYLTKGRSTDEVLRAIRHVTSEGKYVTGTLAGLMLAGGLGDDVPHDRLSTRELDVLMMIGRGTTPSVVAANLSVSPSTVSTYLKRIKTKLSLESLGDLVQYAVRAGLVDD